MNKLLPLLLFVAASSYGAVSVIYPGTVVAGGFVGDGSGITNNLSSWNFSSLTNATNYGGTAFSSPGAASGTEQFGSGAVANTSGAMAIGSGDATGTNSLCIGKNSTASANRAIAIGRNATATASQSLAIGDGAGATLANSVAIGLNAAATAANQIMLGTSSLLVSAPGGLQSQYLALTNSASAPTSNSFWVIFGNSAGVTNHMLKVVAGSLDDYWCEGTNIYSKALAP